MEDINIETYRAIAERCYGKEVATAIFDYWNTINKLAYGGELPPPLITFEIMPYGSAVGMSITTRGHIKIYKPGGEVTLSIDPQTVGILLHETIHYAQDYVGEMVEHTSPLVKPRGVEKSSHNSLYWITEINRIHRLTTWDELGADFVKMVRVDGKPQRKALGTLSRKELGTWPHSVPGAPEKIYQYLTNNMKKI